MDPTAQMTPSSQLCSCLSLLQHRLQLCRDHDIPLNLQLSTHEKILSIRLSLDKLAEVFIRENECGWEGQQLSNNRTVCSLLTIGLPPCAESGAFSNFTFVLQVNIPAFRFPIFVLQLKAEDGLGLLDGFDSRWLIGL